MSALEENIWGINRTRNHRFNFSNLLYINKLIHHHNLIILPHNLSIAFSMKPRFYHDFNYDIHDFNLLILIHAKINCTMLYLVHVLLSLTSSNLLYSHHLLIILSKILSKIYINNCSLTFIIFISYFLKLYRYLNNYFINFLIIYFKQYFNKLQNNMILVYISFL